VLAVFLNRETDMSDITRKLPKQARALQTIETILEATAQILAEDGSERLTTNHLARKAGFSIGTVYQYFPNKESIVLALIERQREETGRRIQALLDRCPDDSAAEKIRAIIGILHAAFAAHRMPERRFALALLKIAVAQGLPTPPNIAVNAIVEIWTEANGTADPLTESEAFVLTRSVIEVLRQATLHASPLLGTAEFENALVRLVFGFLGAGRRADPGVRLRSSPADARDVCRA
jgi:AcrR family transcriptional regulator